MPESFLLDNFFGVANGPNWIADWWKIKFGAEQIYMEQFLSVNEQGNFNFGARAIFEIEWNQAQPINQPTIVDWPKLNLISAIQTSMFLIRLT